MGFTTIEKSRLLGLMQKKKGGELLLRMRHTVRVGSPGINACGDGFLSLKQEATLQQGHIKGCPHLQMGAAIQAHRGRVHDAPVGQYVLYHESSAKSTTQF